MEQKWQHHHQNHQNHQKKEKFKCHIAYDLDIWFFSISTAVAEWCIEFQMKFCQEQNEERKKKLETEESNFRSIAFIAYLSWNGKFLSDSIPSDFCTRNGTVSKRIATVALAHTRRLFSCEFSSFYYDLVVCPCSCLRLHLCVFVRVRARVLVTLTNQFS